VKKNPAMQRDGSKAISAAYCDRLSFAILLIDMPIRKPKSNKFSLSGYLLI
jgi:hypothetical protein